MPIHRLNDGRSDSQFVRFRLEREGCGAEYCGFCPLNQFSMDCVHDRFQTVMCSQFLIDVVQMISQGLQADIKRFRNICGTLPFGEPAKNVFLLL